MKNVRRISLVAVAVLAVSALAFAGEMESAKGRVDAVSGNTVTVIGDDGQAWDFEVTQSTKVLAVGAGHKSRELEAVGKKREISQFLREGERVVVQYWEEDDTLFIKTVRLD